MKTPRIKWTSANDAGAVWVNGKVVFRGTTSQCEELTHNLFDALDLKAKGRIYGQVTTTTIKRGMDDKSPVRMENACAEFIETSELDKQLDLLLERYSQTTSHEECKLLLAEMEALRQKQQ
jgi:hypothetical protein